jgi:hypothetical protein
MRALRQWLRAATAGDVGRGVVSEHRGWGCGGRGRRQCWGVGGLRAGAASAVGSGAPGSVGALGPGVAPSWAGR